MSHRLVGRIPSKIKCGIDIMRAALIDIIPEWEQYLKDADGKKQFTGRINEYSGQYDILIPHSDPFLAKAGHRSDIGFKHEADGSWTIHHDYLNPYDKGGKLGEKLAQLPALDAKSEWCKKFFELSKGTPSKLEHLVAVSIYTVIMKRFAQKLNNLGFEDVSMQKVPGRTLVGGTIDADKIQGMKF